MNTKSQKAYLILAGLALVAGIILVTKAADAFRDFQAGQTAQFEQATGLTVEK